MHYIPKDFELDAEEIGLNFAGSPNNYQAQLLKSFCKGMIKRMEPKALNGQLWSIAECLDTKTADTLRKLVQLFDKINDN